MASTAQPGRLPPHSSSLISLRSPFGTASRRAEPSQHVAIKNREMRPSSKKHKLRAGTNAGGKRSPVGEGAAVGVGHIRNSPIPTNYVVGIISCLFSLRTHTHTRTTWTSVDGVPRKKQVFSNLLTHPQRTGAVVVAVIVPIVVVAVPIAAVVVLAGSV